jgi:phosphohistidine phosphatase
MNLYFLRHGIAAERPPDGSDSPERPLTDEGIARMQLAARGMRRLGVDVDTLLTSPLLRARQTASIVAERLDVTPEVTELLAPGAPWRALLNELEQRGARRVMLVGHEPDLSLTISALTGGGLLQLKKGGMALVELPPDSESDGVLHWLMTPKTLRILGER